MRPYIALVCGFALGFASSKTTNSCNIWAHNALLCIQYPIHAGLGLGRLRKVVGVTLEQLIWSCLPGSCHASTTRTLSRSSLGSRTWPRLASRLFSGEKNRLAKLNVTTRVTVATKIVATWLNRLWLPQDLISDGCDVQLSMCA